jgi:Thiol-disulfide isomerase and thioredoxins
MRLRLRYFVPILLLVGLVALFAAGLHLNPTYVPSPFVGKPAPKLDLPILLPAPAAGQPPQRLTTRSLLGHPVLVNFFASWCVGCHEEHEYLLQLAREYQVPIIGIDYKIGTAILSSGSTRPATPTAWWRSIAWATPGSTGVCTACRRPSCWMRRA